MLYDDSPNLTNRLTILHKSPTRRNPISVGCVSCELYTYTYLPTQ